MWHMGGQNDSIGYDQHRHWWHLDNDAWKQSNSVQPFVEGSATHAAVP